jgi:hypothetical protein
MPEFNPLTNYGDEYWKTYLQNEIHCALIRDISEKKAQLTELIAQIEVLPPTCRACRMNTTASIDLRIARRIDDLPLR